MVVLRERLEKNVFVLFFQTNLGISDLRKSKKDLSNIEMYSSVKFCERIQENKEGKKT